MAQAARKPIRKSKTVARDLGISPKTEARYNSALATLLPTLEKAGDVTTLDPLCEEWVEMQWIGEGAPMGMIGDALCGLQHYWPQLKGHWRRIEVIERAPPLPRPVALALIGLFLSSERPGAWVPHLAQNGRNLGATLPGHLFEERWARSNHRP